MWKHKLCLGTSGSFGLSVPEQIKLFKEIGFDGFFTGWSRGCGIKEWKASADELGMIYQRHAPFHYAAKMWRRSEEADAAVDDLWPVCATVPKTRCRSWDACIHRV